MSSLARIAVVGASLAGLRCVEALREGGFEGELIVVGEEPHAPYNRVPLSKHFLTDEVAGLDTVAFPLDVGLDVSWRLGARAVRLQMGDRSLETTAGTIRDLDAVVVATGSRARGLPGVPDGVLTLRTLEDGVALRERVRMGGSVVVVGGGLIGAEIASSCVALGVPVSIVERAATLMRRAIPASAGARLTEVHRNAGVDLRLGRRLTRFLGDRRVGGVELDDGSRIAADTVVIAAGSIPCTDWLEGTGMDLSDGVLTDTAGRVPKTAGRVLAIGDVARASRSEHRGQHWTKATDDAARAATALLTGETATRALPFFWSTQHGHRIQVVGRPEAGTEVAVVDQPERGWAMEYSTGALLVGAVAVGLPARLAAARRRLQQQEAGQVVGVS